MVDLIFNNHDDGEHPLVNGCIVGGSAVGGWGWGQRGGPDSSNRGDGKQPMVNLAAFVYGEIVGSCAGPCRLRRTPEHAFRSLPCTCLIARLNALPPALTHQSTQQHLHGHWFWVRWWWCLWLLRRAVMGLAAARLWHVQGPLPLRHPAR